MMPPVARAMAACLAAGALAATAGCAAWPRRYGSTSCCIETKPAVRRQPVWWHLFDVTVLEPLEAPFHLMRVGRRIAGSPIRSLNLRDGRVTGSAFLEDRDPSRLTAEQVRWGPTRPEDLAVPPLTVTRLKDEGKTAGFFATDSRGVRYLLKLDPVNAPELLSGAEVVTSKLLHSLGYRVPSYEIIRLQAGELLLAPNATVKAPGGANEPLAQEVLDRLIEPRLHDGRLRVSGTRLLEGDILGPASFKTFRDCAEVRALKVAYAWVNDIDTKDHNSLLVWNGTETVGYLIDFGTALGADAGLAGPKTPCAGWTNIVDMEELSLELVTLGFHRPVCDPQPQPVSSNIGLFTGNVNPDRWKPYAPNVAFKEMNQEDARWIARRLHQLLRPQIEAAVSAGQYSAAGEAAYLTDVLDARRRAIVDHYLREELEEEQEALEEEREKRMKQDST